MSVSPADFPLTPGKMGIILKMLIGFRQQSEKLMFAGMAGGKFVTTACNYRNTIGGVLGIVSCANWRLTHWRGSALGSPFGGAVSEAD